LKCSLKQGDFNTYFSKLLAGLRRIDWNTIERTILKWRGVFETQNIVVL